MDFNAYILDWTMSDYDQLKEKLERAGFSWVQVGDSEYLRVVVSFEKAQEFAAVCQPHLNSPYNYVDLQYPDEGKTIVVFQQRVFEISSQEENDKVKQWAVALGLPPAQAEWATSF